MTQSASPVPLIYNNLPNIITGLVTTQTPLTSESINGSNQEVVYTYTFKQSRLQTPDSNWIFLAFKELDFKVNRGNGNNNYVMKFEVSVAQTQLNELKIKLLYQKDLLTSAKISLLVIENKCVFKDIFYRQELKQQPSGTNTLSFTAKFQEYQVLTYLQQFNLGTTSYQTDIFDQKYQVNKNGNSYSISTSLYNSHGPDVYYGLSFHLVLLVVYPKHAAENFGLIVQAFSVEQDNNSVLNQEFSYYSDQNSILFVGLSRFKYKANHNQQSKALMWSITQNSNNPNPFKLAINLDANFEMFGFSFLMINKIDCPSTHQLIEVDRDSQQTSCFDSCYEDQYLIYNQTTTKLECKDCNMTLCKTCVAASKCNTCNDNFDFNPSNFSCTPSPGFFLNSQNQSQKCEDIIDNCLNCTNSTTCTQCQVGFYINQSNECSSCSLIHPNCSRCNDTHCMDCNPPKTLINSTECSDSMDPQPLPDPNGRATSCKDQNCISCQQPSNCSSCSSSLYNLSNGQCLTVCGDGVIFGTEVCDDGNQINFDGCSSDCQTLENGFVCANVSSQMPGFFLSDCYFNNTITLNVASIEKPLTENKLNLYFNNPHPKINAWQQIDRHNELTQAFTLSVPRFDSGVPGYFFNYTASFVKSPDLISKLRVRSNSLSLDELYSQTAQTRLLQSSVFTPEHYEFIMLEVSYLPDAPGSAGQPHIDKESLNHQTMAISFDPKLSQRTIFTKGAAPLLFSSSFKLKADDNQVIQFYDESYYEKVGQIEALSMVIGFSCLLLMVIGLASFCVDGRNSKQMLVAVETAFVVQLSYFSLLGVGQTNPLFLSMASGLKFSSGYDVMLDEEGSQTFRKLEGIDIGSVRIFSNVNVSFSLVLLCMIAGGVFMLLEKFKKKSSESQCQSEQIPNESLVQQEKHVKEEDKSDETSKTDKFVKKESTYQKIGMFLVFNAGFGLFLFFLYKFLFSFVVQLKYGMESLSAIDMIVMASTMLMLVFYGFCLVRKLDWFKTFTLKLTLRQPKINIMETLVKNKVIEPVHIKRIQKRFLNYVKDLPDSQKPKALRQVEMSATRINIKLWYLMIILIEHTINSVAVVLLSSLFSFNQIIAITLYFASLIFVYKFSPYPASSLYRLYWNYIVGFVVQTLLLVRSMILEYGLSESEVGRTETSLGVYFPFSIVILLILLCAVGLFYSVYGIRRIRCCDLQMDWEKIGLTGVMKLKLENFIMEELNGKFHSNLIGPDGEIIASQGEDDQILIQKLENQSSDTQNLGAQGPYNTRNRKYLSKIKELDIKINQQITTKSLKKEIKQKLITNKIDKKIREKERFKLEGTESSYRRNESQCENYKILGTDLFETQKDHKKNQKNSPNKKVVSNLMRQKYLGEVELQNGGETEKVNSLNDVKEEKEAYIYTDNQNYNVYEEFDMI